MNPISVYLRKSGGKSGMERAKTVDRIQRRQAVSEATSSLRPVKQGMGAGETASLMSQKKAAKAAAEARHKQTGILARLSKAHGTLKK